MANTYHANGERAIDFTLYKSGIAQLKKEWKQYAASIPPYPGGFEGRGIVMCAGGLSYYTCCYIAIKALRRSGCQLPIEVWYAGNELSEEAIFLLAGLQVECRDLLQYKGAPKYGYWIKPYSILKSRFREIMYIDADNVCVRDPEELFGSQQYRETGALFWPDFWRTSRENPIWQIVESDQYTIPEQESGQLVIDKKRCWKELNLCQFFNQKSDIYYQLLAGDKDTFKFAWLALKTPFHMIETGLSACGYRNKHNNQFHGITMVQHNTQGDICFLHRNLLKWDITMPNEKAWQTIKKFLPGARQKEYHFEKSFQDGHLYTDLAGDVAEIDFPEACGNIEDLCLHDLQELRNSAMYARFMAHYYMANHRYPRHVYFSMNDNSPSLTGYAYS